MIKVIHVISDTNIGGAGRLLLNCLRNFSRDEFLIKVILPRDSLLKHEIESLLYEVIEIEGNSDKSLDFKSIKILKRIFKEEKPDIVHTHASMSARIAAFLAGVKTKLYTRHCAFEPRKILTVFPVKQLFGIFDNILTNKIIATAVVAKNDLIKTGIKEKKIEVILNGVDPITKYSEDEILKIKEKLGITPQDFVVGIIARLEENKGQKYFINTINLLRNKNVKGLIVGDGSARATFLEQVVNLKLQNNIIFTGFQKDVTPFMNIIDVNINCSNLSETSCLSLAEGMSLGKPAIATICGGNSDMISDGENGFLVPINDSNELGEKIETLINDKELYKSMSENAKKVYKEKFTADVMTSSVQKLYNTLMGEGRGTK